MVTAAWLALMIAATPPPALEHIDDSMVLFQQRPAAVESSHMLLSKWEVTPMPGFGFGGLGVGPGFTPFPFGGFGVGFRIQNRPTEQQLLEARKQELSALQTYESNLARHIQSMEQQQQQQQPSPQPAKKGG